MVVRFRLFDAKCKEMAKRCMAECCSASVPSAWLPTLGDGEDGWHSVADPKKPKAIEPSERVALFVGSAPYPSIPLRSRDVSHRHVIRGSPPVRELEHLLRLDPELIQGGFHLVGTEVGGDRAPVSTNRGFGPPPACKAIQ